MSQTLLPCRGKLLLAVFSFLAFSFPFFPFSARRFLSSRRLPSPRRALLLRAMLSSRVYDAATTNGLCFGDNITGDHRCDTYSPRQLAKAMRARRAF